MLMFNTFDLVLLALLAVGLLRGIFRGLSGELAGLIGFAVAVLAGWHFYRPLGEYLSETTRMTAVQSDTTAVVVIVMGALIILWAVSMVMRQIMEVTFRGLLERVGGAIVGVLRYGIVLAALLLVADQFVEGEARRHAIDESYLGQLAVTHLTPLYEDLVTRYPELPALSPADDGNDFAPNDDSPEEW